MVKLHGPLMDQSVHGWLGNDQYAYFGFVHQPYPIGLLPFIHVPYSLWARKFFGTYHVPAFGFRPYPGFIGQYYSGLGWCYQMRRTWHGIIWSAMRPPISVNKKSPAQLVCQFKFYYAVKAWQGMNQGTKDYYGRLKYPVHAAGFNRFLHYYLLDKPC